MKSMCLDFVVKDLLCSVNCMFPPPISTTLSLVNCTDLLSDGF